MLNQNCDTANLLAHYDTEASLAPPSVCEQPSVAAMLVCLLGQLVHLGV